MEENNTIHSVEALHEDVDKFINELFELKFKRIIKILKDESLKYESKRQEIVEILMEKIPGREEILNCLSRCVVFQEKIYFAPKESIDNNTNLDKLFLHEVNLFNPSMFSISEVLIKEIRTIYPEGMLKKESDHYFIESPLNFWAVWNQVNNRDLKISIYGIPADYETNLSLTLFDRSYSTFYISNEKELSEGILLIRQALERKNEFGLK